MDAAGCTEQKGYVTLHADIRPGYEFERAIIHHDRPDSSEYVIRSQESRFNCRDRVIAADTGEIFPARGWPEISVLPMKRICGTWESLKFPGLTCLLIRA